MVSSMIVETSHKIHSRPFEGEADFWRVRELLVETYPLTPLGFNWEIRRWDGQRFHRKDAAINPDWYEQVRLWETSDGRLVGAAHPDGAGEMALEVHPDYRQIELEMIVWAEDSLDVYTSQQRQIETFALDGDAYRADRLSARGFEATPYGGVMRRMRLAGREFPRAAIPQGYFLRSTRSEYEEYTRMAALLNAAFNRSIHTAEEYAPFVRLSPSFRHLLNLVAEAPDGSFASHVGVSYDKANRLAIFEPVCTHPDHQRKGLARALMIEGAKRVRALGAVEAVVGTGDGMAANQLYEAVGFTEVNHGLIWRKVW
jgi:predicted N-acetyltransferase YhbS